MSIIVKLNVEGRTVDANDLKYNELISLYSDFIKRNGRVPTYADCTSKNNLPQPKIVKSLLSSHNILYEDFISSFGKTAHIRSNANNYSSYIKKYKLFASKLGRAPTVQELTNNCYGLPSAGWLYKNCPDKSVSSYSEFVKWLSIEPKKKQWSKDEVSDALIRLEKRIHRPIRKSDITVENVSFSNIVVHRIFGSLDEARRQCGLLYHTPSEKEKDISHYVDILDSVVLDFINTTGREQITWRDIESGLYGTKTYTHKTFLKMFSKSNIDIKKHLKSVGVTLCGDSSFSYKYIFDDGELVRSGMEYDMTQFIKNEMGLKYGYDYIRDVKYNRFADTTSKIDCDYVIISSHHPLFIEVAGMIDNTDSNDWIIKDYASDIKRDYRDTLAYKAYILNDINAKYLFLFSNDMLDGSYKNKVRHFIEMNCA